MIRANDDAVSFIEVEIDGIIFIRHLLFIILVGALDLLRRAP